MSFEDRIVLIKKLEEIRDSKIICLLTSLRQGVSSLIAEDSVRVMFDHLLLFPTKPADKIDLFLVSNGGSATVPWRLVSLFREFSNSFNVLIPYRAYSAATLISLGADEIVMHPFGELGPIDPTVSNEFNPTEENKGRRLGISVEDVKAYIEFIKTTVGITHEDELVRTIEILAEKVHPLALGNVERFLSQSRLMARKILFTHMDKNEEHKIDEIVENLASKLYFHGHPINRMEAKNDLGLKVNTESSGELEDNMWELYKLYEEEFDNLSAFNPAAELATLPPTEGQNSSKEFEITHAMIESEKLSSKYTTLRRMTLIPGAQPGQQAIKDEVLS